MSSTMPSKSFRLRTLSRVGAAVLGGYAFAWGMVALVTSALFAARMDFHDAEFLGALAGLLGYLCVSLWAVTTQRLLKAWVLLVSGGALMAGVASLLQSILV